MDSTPLFDSHCHLDFPDFDQDRNEVLERCDQSGIRAICIPGTEAKQWQRALNLTSKNTSTVKLYPTLGIHPFFLEGHNESDLNVLKQRLSDNRHGVKALGEIGLDFTLPNTDKQKQLYFFTEQLKLAREFNLPVIIHARKSHDPILKLLRTFNQPRGGIVHAFSGSRQQAEQYIEAGFKLGFGGSITYPRASKTRRLASELPLEAIVLETDAPDMPLSGYQGQRNSPERLPLVLQTLVELRQESSRTIAQRVFSNAEEILLQQSRIK